MDSVEEAARRTAINLMRLNEALELEDAEGYSQAVASVHPNGYEYSHRQLRRRNIVDFYKRWFRDVAGSSQMGSLDKGTHGSSGGPAATSGGG